MLPLLIAAHPGTPAGVLTHLTDLALDGPRPTSAPNRGALELARALASNSSLRPADLARLLGRETSPLWVQVMRRPGLTPAEALTLIGDATSAQPWVSALTSVTDPGDVLVHRAIAAAPHVEVTGRALAVATSPAGVRAAAAAHLSQPQGNSVHRDLLTAAFIAHPDLLEVGGRHRGVRLPAPWTGPTGPAALDHALTGGPGEAIAVLRGAPDPDAALAAQIVAAYPREEAVLLAALGRALLPDAVRNAAAGHILGRDGALPTSHRCPVRAGLYRTLLTGPTELVMAYFTKCSAPTWADMNYLLGRMDLSGEDLTVLATRVVELVQQATYADQGHSEWAITLALHPNATPQVRRVAAAAVPRAAAAGAGAGQRRAACAALIARRHAEDPVAALGAELPAAALGLTDLTPAMTCAINAALTDLLPQLADDCGPALTAVGASFTGTVGELVRVTSSLRT